MTSQTKIASRPIKLRRHLKFQNTKQPLKLKMYYKAQEKDPHRTARTRLNGTAVDKIETLTGSIPKMAEFDMAVGID